MSAVTEQPQEQKPEVQENGTSVPAENGADPAPSANDDGTGEDGKNVKTGRQMRQEGQRNLQDSTFSISEELDRSELKTSVRVRQPPGGMSSGGFW